VLASSNAGSAVNFSAGTKDVFVTNPANAIDQRSCKGWIQFEGTGTIAIQDSYNVSGIGDNDVGQYTVTWDDDLANANYCAVVQAISFHAYATNIASGSLQIHTSDNSHSYADASDVCCAIFGDQ
jgi:hypothetical protein